MSVMVVVARRKTTGTRPTASDVSSFVALM